MFEPKTNSNVYLYIASHNRTGLKYFGKTNLYFTNQSLQNNYHGSGIYWINHLKKYRDDGGYRLKR